MTFTHALTQVPPRPALQTVKGCRLNGIKHLRLYLIAISLAGLLWQPPLVLQSMRNQLAQDRIAHVVACIQSLDDALAVISPLLGITLCQIVIWLFSGVDVVGHFTHSMLFLVDSSPGRKTRG